MPGARGIRCSSPTSSATCRSPPPTRSLARAITYHIGPDRAIAGASHSGSVLSLLHPGQPWDDDVMTTFCHYVLQFTGPASAERWTAAHPGTFMISLGDAAELARRHAARAFGAAPR